MSSSSNFKTPLPMGEGLGVRLLKQYWGYDTFRGIQEDIINSITEGRDTLGLMPTGGGKSITFQVPALAKEGLCLVITPLIALMKDQVQNLKKRGIKALAIYSGMSRQEIIVTLENWRRRRNTAERSRCTLPRSFPAVRYAVSAK